MYIEHNETVRNSESVGKTRLSLLDAVKFDLGMDSNTGATSMKGYKKYDEQNYESEFIISLGLRTGRPDSDLSLANINIEKRFKTRVAAFNFLNKYWVSSKKSSRFEMPLRSTSPLRTIFEYQEENIFDVPQVYLSATNYTFTKEQHVPDSIRIEISQFEESTDSKKGSKRGVSKNKKLLKSKKKATLRKNTSLDQNNIITGLSSILSDLESEDTTNPTLKASDISISKDFSTAMKSFSKKSTKSSSSQKGKKKATKSSKGVSQNGIFLNPSIKAVKTRTTSLSYSTKQMMGLIKDLDEISSGLESINTPSHN